jgi:hypothetical protein
MAEQITVQSIVHDRRIEIPAPPGYVEEVQVVSVTVAPTGGAQPDSSAAIASAFGLLSPEEGAALDQFLAESRHWHAVERRDQGL